MWRPAAGRYSGGMDGAAAASRLSTSEQPGENMNTFVKALAIVSVAASLGACSGMSTQDRNTAIGAGVGAVGGAALTGGSALGTVGGAAVGGVVGHEINRH
jgi:osmotically inducible lipoprotein OsmB